MSKVFTITKGLENLGSLKTGGQATVYKGKRVGEIITAIKIIPTPVFSENEKDKNYLSFKNEVEKLTRVNEDANANVVSILSYGITESGNFPYIEMEFIEGPELAELLQQNKQGIFEIKNLLVVAEHLSNALAHCHKADVKHGDIKTNNIKLNKRTGNYILLDFGLSVMSDEQRRTSFRHAGAIEFMAPEQNDGDLFFETDVYSFGVILFELITGQVPFPLKDNGETSRNAVMVAHLEAIPPEMKALREAKLPQHWSEEKKEAEMKLPGWLINMVYKCLEKKPADRFANGMELHEYVMKHKYTTLYNEGASSYDIDILNEANQRLEKEVNILQQQLQEAQQIQSIKNYNTSSNVFQSLATKRKWRIKANIAALIILLLAILAYYFYPAKPSTPNELEANTNTSAIYSELADARDHLNNSRLAAALLIYKDLAEQEVPEAMYHYGNLALQGRNSISCEEGLNYIHRSADKNFAQAKKTLGFLYAFAADENSLKLRGYTGCTFQRNINYGSKLLMEAQFAGDPEAGKLLQELDAQIRTGKWKSQ